LSGFFVEDILMTPAIVQVAFPHVRDCAAHLYAIALSDDGLQHLVFVQKNKEH
jgi:hypothetical protein